MQPDLAATFETLRTQGVQGFYAGGFAQQFVAAADAAGGGLTIQDMNAAAPHFAAPVTTTRAMPPPPSCQTRRPAGPQPATASFAALDRNGGIVACATTLNNLFGTGRIAARYRHPARRLARHQPRRNTRRQHHLRTSCLTFRAATTGTGNAAISRAQHHILPRRRARR